MNTDGTGFHTCKEFHKTESIWNHTTTDHKEGKQLEDKRSAGPSSCNSGDGTDQRVQSLMFMMMMILKLRFTVSIRIVKNFCDEIAWKLEDMEYWNADACEIRVVLMWTGICTDWFRIQRFCSEKRVRVSNDDFFYTVYVISCNKYFTKLGVIFYSVKLQNFVVAVMYTYY